MYELIGLVLYATIITGVAIVSLVINYIQAKSLPDTMYSVGMAIRDHTMEEFGIVNPNTGESTGGRPVEGGLGTILHYAEKFGIIDKIMGSVGKSSATKTYKPGLE